MSSCISIGSVCCQPIQATSRLRRRRLTVAWLTTAGMTPARYSTTSATATLATSARLGMITAGSANSAARPTHETATRATRIRPTRHGSATVVIGNAIAVATTATAAVQMTAAT